MTTEFLQAKEQVKTLPKKPSNETLLKLYALYKQATQGDIVGERPSVFDFKGAAKYDAWNKKKHKSKEDAEKEYVEFVNSLLAAE